MPSTVDLGDDNDQDEDEEFLQVPGQRVPRSWTQSCVCRLFSKSNALGLLVRHVCSTGESIVEYLKHMDDIETYVGLSECHFEPIQILLSFVPLLSNVLPWNHVHAV
jgi:hypothetical protein